MAIMYLLNTVFIVSVTIITLVEAGHPRECYVCNVESPNATHPCYIGDTSMMKLRKCGSKKYECAVFGYEIMRCRDTTLFNMTRACNLGHNKWDCENMQSEAQKLNGEKGYVTVTSCRTCARNKCNNSSHIVITNWLIHVAFFIAILNSYIL